VLTVKNSDVLVRNHQHIQENTLMKIKIIRPTIFRKQQVMPSDEPIEVTKVEAVEIIGAGKAVAVKEAAAETTDQSIEEIETTDTPAVNTESFAPVVMKATEITKADAKRAAKKAEADAKKESKQS
jgi:hypothetical protein